MCVVKLKLTEVVFAVRNVHVFFFFFLLGLNAAAASETIDIAIDRICEKKITYVRAVLQQKGAESASNYLISFQERRKKEWILWFSFVGGGKK